MIRPPPSSTLFPYTTLFRSSLSTSILIRRILCSSSNAGGGPSTLESKDRKSTRLNSSHSSISYTLFFFNDPAPTEFYPLPLHDALPIFIVNFNTNPANSLQL